MGVVRFIKGIAEFAGSRRRSEIIGEAGGILFMDDYAHHPSAIKTTLAGYREFFPGRRLVVDFMSHTYTRTGALFDEFVSAFNDADVLILHKIYSSAREKAEAQRVTGKSLYEAIASFKNNVHYFEEPEEALDFCRKELLKKGDLFLSMGAGNNWQLCHSLYNKINEEPLA